MQERKGLYRFVRKELVAAGVVFALILFPTILHGFDHIHAWSRGMGGVHRPGPWDHRLFSDSTGVYMCVMTSCCRPYSLEDLTASRIETVVAGPHLIFSAWWGLLYHYLYREERFQSHVFILCPGEVAVFGIAAGMVRKKIDGFDPESKILLSGSLLLGTGEKGQVEIRTSFVDIDSEPMFEPLVSARLVFSPIELVFNFDSKGWSNGDNRMGVKVGTGSEVYLLSGYRFATGEVSGGVLYSGGRTAVSFSWSSHPVLGDTFSVGVGRKW